MLYCHGGVKASIITVHSTLRVLHLKARSLSGTASGAASTTWYSRVDPLIRALRNSALRNLGVRRGRV